MNDAELAKDAAFERDSVCRTCGKRSGLFAGYCDKHAVEAVTTEAEERRLEREIVEAAMARWQATEPPDDFDFTFDDACAALAKFRAGAKEKA
jgi:ribosomal protein L40E